MSPARTAPGRRHPRQARGGVVVRDGPRPPGLHLLFPLPVESTQITKSADHRGPKNFFLSRTLLSEVPLRTASCAVADSCQVSLLTLPNLQRRHRVASTTTARKQHMPSPRWQPGQSGNPSGRLRGSRNRLSEEVICALLRDFRQHGQKAVARLRKTQPAAYLKILALLVPREHKVEHRNLLKEMTDEELEAAIEALQAMMATQAENAKVIEGTAHDTALPIPTECEQPPHQRRNRLLEHVDTAIGPSRKPR